MSAQSTGRDDIELAPVASSVARIRARSLRRAPRTLVADAIPVLASGLLILFTALLLRWSWWPGQVSYRVGDVATEDVVAPRHVDYISQIKTQQERQLATASVGTVSRYDAGIAQERRRRAIELMDRIAAIRASASATNDQKRDRILQAAGPSFSQITASDAVSLTEPEWNGARAVVSQALNQFLTMQVRPEDVLSVQQKLLAGVPSDLTPAQTAVVAQLVITAVQPNSFPDSGQSAAARQDAAARSGPVHVVINKGEVIVHRGDRVQPEDVERLEALGLLKGGVRPDQLGGTLLLVMCLLAPMLLYVRFFQPEMWTRKAFALLMVILLVSLVAARVSTLSRPDVTYLFPIATASMLIGVFLDVPLALLATGALGVLLSTMVGQPFEQLVVTLVGGVVGVLGLWRVERLANVFRAGLLVSLATSAAAWSFSLTQSTVDTTSLTIETLQSVANGLLSAVLTAGAFGILGYLFGITTSWQLMDLARPNHPLLQRLLLEAPGTYHHSLLVSNLAERAAVEIGADALLARVGAFYHDVGKTLHPYFFIENQMDQPNIHSKLPPDVSAQMIAAHVTDGVKLAQHYKLPSSIQDIIWQHHGTRLIGFFLSQERAQSPGGKPIDESKFHYPGPKPQTREAALIMLADAVEAAARASNAPSIDEVEKIVDHIFQERIAEGELSECDVSLKDMSKAREAFLIVLRGLFHRRIDYPSVAVVSDAE